MPHPAEVSAGTFWGDFALILGSVFVLFSLVKSGMTTTWTKRLTVFGACLLAVGTALTTGNDLEAYGDKHELPAYLAFTVLAVAFVALLAHILRSNVAK